MGAPKEIRRLNQIIRMWEQPCRVGFEIWIETLLPALIPVLISFITPGSVEVIEIWLGRYHGLGGKALRRGARLVFPNFTDASDRIFLWKILNPIERILFWWMIIDLTEDFFFSWESMAMKAAGCFAGSIHCDAYTNDFDLVANDVGYQPIYWTAQDDLHHMCTVDGFTIPPNFNGSVGSSVKMSGLGGGPSFGRTRTLNGITGQIMFESQWIAATVANAKSSIRWFDFAGTPTGVFVKMQVECSGYPIDIGGSSASASGTPTSG